MWYVIDFRINSCRLSNLAFGHVYYLLFVARFRQYLVPIMCTYPIFCYYYYNINIIQIDTVAYCYFKHIILPLGYPSKLRSVEVAAITSFTATIHSSPYLFMTPTCFTLDNWGSSDSKCLHDENHKVNKTPCVQSIKGAGRFPVWRCLQWKSFFFVYTLVLMSLSSRVSGDRASFWLSNFRARVILERQI